MSRIKSNASLVFCCFVATLIAVSLPAFGQPTGNSALDFDGVDDYIEVQDPVGIAGPFTIEAWVLVRDAAGGRICSNTSGITGYDFDFYSGGSGMVLRFAISNNSQITADFSGHLGVWTHVAVCGNGEIGEDVSLFIGGEFAATAIVDQTLMASSTNLRIGCLTVDMYYFDGAMDELRIWNAELDQATLRTYMNRHVGAGHPCYGCMAGYWCFDEGTGQMTASEVGGGLCDGRLGHTIGEDVADPTWITSGVTPTETWSLGRLKASYW